MIKINLLLPRKKDKKGGIRKEFIILILSIVFLVVILGVIHYLLEKEKSNTLAKISETKKEIAYYKSLTTEVLKAKEAQKVLQDKLNVINSLRKEKASLRRC